MRKLSIITSLGLLIYSGVYIGLSSFGRYEPTIWGFNRGSFAPKESFYEWAPYRFVDNWLWRRPLFALYFPLLKLDQYIWHDWNNRWSGRFAVHQFVVTDAEQAAPSEPRDNAAVSNPTPPALGR